MLNLVNALRSNTNMTQTVLAGWDFRLGEAPSLSGIDLKLVSVARKNVHQTGLRAIAAFLWRGGRALRSLDVAACNLVHFHLTCHRPACRHRARKAVRVLFLHGIDVPGFVQEEGALFRKLATPVNRQVLKHAACLFAPSRQIADMVLETCPQARVEVIPHGVEADLLLPKESYPAHARRFVTIARLAPWKRVDRLVEAIIELRRKFPDVSLDIYGEGEQRAKIERLVRSAGAGKHITLHGIVSKEVLRSTLSGYDAFVLPSISEAFGIVFLEGMAAGLPVVGFNYGGPAEIIRRGVDGLLIERDTLPALLDALEQLASTAGLAARKGRSARVTAVERYSWPALAQRYFAAYNAAMASGA